MDWFSFKQDFALVYGIHSCQHVKYRCFSGPVRPDNAYNFTFVYFKAHFINCYNAAEAFCNSRHLQYCHTGFPPLPAAPARYCSAPGRTAAESRRLFTCSDILYGICDFQPSSPCGRNRIIITRISPYTTKR